MNIFQGSCVYIFEDTAFLEILEKLGPGTGIFFKKPCFFQLFVSVMKSCLVQFLLLIYSDLVLFFFIFSEHFGLMYVFLM